MPQVRHYLEALTTTSLVDGIGVTRYPNRNPEFSSLLITVTSTQSSRGLCEATDHKQAGSTTLRAVLLARRRLRLRRAPGALDAPAAKAGSTCVGSTASSASGSSDVLAARHRALDARRTRPGGADPGLRA